MYIWGMFDLLVFKVICIWKAAGGRAKQTEFGVVVTCIWDIFSCSRLFWPHSVGALVSKRPATLKRLTVEGNGVKFGSLGQS